MTRRGESGARQLLSIKAARRLLRSSRLREVLRGSWLGHPLHPLIITVPIGAWVCASALDVQAGNEDAARRIGELLAASHGR